MLFKVDQITARVKVSFVRSLYPGSSYIIYFACHSKPILFVLVRIRRQPAFVSVSDSFSSCIQRIEQNKQKRLFHFPVLEKRPYFLYSLTLIRFALYFGTTLFIANLLSGGYRRGAPVPPLILRPPLLISGSEPPRLRAPPPYLKVWIRHCFSLFYRIPIQKRHFVQTLDCEIVPGGYSWEFLVGWVPPGSPNLDSISDHTCFQTWPLKSLPVFRPGGGRSQNTTT